MLVLIIKTAKCSVISILFGYNKSISLETKVSKMSCDMHCDFDFGGEAIKIPSRKTEYVENLFPRDNFIV